MSEIQKIRNKKLTEMTKLELLAIRQDTIRLINYSDNIKTIYQNKRYLEKIDKRLKELNYGKNTDK